MVRGVGREGSVVGRQDGKFEFGKVRADWCQVSNGEYVR